jgi:hypothetical protein
MPKSAACRSADPEVALEVAAVNVALYIQAHNSGAVHVDIGICARSPPIRRVYDAPGSGPANAACHLQPLLPIGDQRDPALIAFEMNGSVGQIVAARSIIKGAITGKRPVHVLSSVRPGPNGSGSWPRRRLIGEDPAGFFRCRPGRWPVGEQAAAGPIPIPGELEGVALVSASRVLYINHSDIVVAATGLLNQTRIAATVDAAEAEVANVSGNRQWRVALATLVLPRPTSQHADSNLIAPKLYVRVVVDPHADRAPAVPVDCDQSLVRRTVKTLPSFV